jgi:hypothetical protein
MISAPPSVALLNYISSGILWRIFSQTGIFAGFSLRDYADQIYIAGCVSASVTAGDIVLFSMYYSPEGTAKLRWVGRGGGGGEGGHCIF